MTREEFLEEENRRLRDTIRFLTVALSETSAGIPVQVSPDQFDLLACEQTVTH